MTHISHNADAQPTQPTPDVAGTIPSPQNLDYDWILICGFVLTLTQVGFAFINAGSVRYKNVQSSVIKVLLGLFLTITIWWLFGFGFSFGNDYQTKFLGGSKLGGYAWESNQYSNDYANYVFRVGGAATAIAILSGAAVERMTFLGWAILSVIYSGFVYAALVHWTLASGWLSTYGYKDFSGAGVNFFAAGVAGLIVTILLKPRQQVFDQAHGTHATRHSPIYIAFGSLLVFAGWLFFNGGIVAQGSHAAYVQGLVAVNTLIAGATSGVVSFVIRYLQYEATSLVALSRGVLAGIVAVSAAADDLKPWSAFLFGLFAAVIYSVLAKALPKAHIDDPVEVVPVYLGAGFIGIVLAAFFDSKAGIFYGFGAKLLGLQLLGLLIIFAWVALFVFLTLIVLKGFGVLKVDTQTESLGIDKTLCLGEAVVFANQFEEAPLVQQTELPVVRSQFGSSLARSGF